MKEKDKWIQTELGWERWCIRCEDYWPPDFFNRKGDGLHSYCRACMTERKRELRADAQRKRTMIHEKSYDLHGRILPPESRG